MAAKSFCDKVTSHEETGSVSTFGSPGSAPPTPSESLLSEIHTRDVPSGSQLASAKQTRCKHTIEQKQLMRRE